MKYWINVSFRKCLFTCVLLLSGVGTEAATFTVNTTSDTSDVDPGDGICSDINGKCSLRAAIMQANFTNAIGPSNTIIIPAGVYTLTRPGNDDGAILGDLDIAQSMTIQGAGSGLTVIDGNGAVTGDRVFQILSSARETSLSGMTIRNGIKTNIFDEGGGLYWEGGGGHLHFNDVIVENNRAYDGGGLSLNYSSMGDVVDMEHVIVRANTATAAIGGLGLNLDYFAGFEMRDSQVYGNTAYQGGGIYLQGTPQFGLGSVRIETTEVYSNSAGLSAGFENHSGDSNVAVVVIKSHLHDNISSIYGGAIGNYGTLIISSTTLNANSAVTRGGGIYNYTGATVTITNSTISSNVVSGSASVPGGGGIYNEGASVSAINSTLSGNSTTGGSGGGIFNGLSFSSAGGTLNLLNCTIASNNAASGFGGGITNQSGTVIAKGTIIAANTAQSAGSGPDFAGILTSSGSSYDLIGNTGGLRFSGAPPIACVFNVNPLLGPLQDNGGPTFTHALLTGSPAIDAGRSIGLTNDQRGAPRPVDDPAVPNANPGDGSDIGAFEAGRPPLLAIQKAGNAAVLSWPFYYGGFSVQSVTNLGSSNAWVTEIGTPVVSSNLYFFTNSPISGKKFYRLKGN